MLWIILLLNILTVLGEVRTEAFKTFSYLCNVLPEILIRILTGSCFGPYHKIKLTLLLVSNCLLDIS